MKAFFDYIFYSYYRFFKWQEHFWNKKGSPVLRKNDLFDSLWLLSILQGFNITAIIIFSVIGIGYSHYLKEFHYIYAFTIITMYIFNRRHYQYKMNYKKVIQIYEKKNICIGWSILYSILSLLIGILSFCSIPEEVFK